jgi:RNA polymerase sigma-70 factor (ECF subfamily)
LSLPGAAAADTLMQAIYEEQADALFRFLLRMTLGERPLAEDLFQETMLRAWRNLDDLPAEVDSRRRWLFTVGRRIAIDAARARNARPTEVMITHSLYVPAPDDLEAATAAEVIGKALPKLSAPHREVLAELYVYGHTTAEAAERLDIPEGTVKSRVWYALRALRAAVGRIDG